MSEQLTLPLHALSIRQPWASLILSDGKDIENRSWSTRFRGPVLVHAAAGMTAGEWDEAMEFADQAAPLLRAEALERRARASTASRGGIVGVVDVVGCVRASPSPWFVGPWGFVLANPRPLPFQACKGRLGFFKPFEAPRPPAPPEADLFTFERSRI